MNTVRKVLVPIDFSESSNAAARYAAEMSKMDKKIEFLLIHVQDEKSNSSLEDLNKLKSEIFDSNGITCQSIVKSGELVETLIEVNDEFGINLIVFGTAGSVDETINSKTAQLLRRADCPVLLIPAGTDAFMMKNIALAVDNKELDDASDLGLFHDLAKWYKSTVHVVTVDRKDQDKITLGETHRSLEYYLDNIDYKMAVPKNSDIEKGIEEYIKDQNIDMLAIMPKHHAKNIERSEGRLTRLLAAHSSVPLLVID
ncbi:universal stress protein [Reichenbachiella versicolor]|uniref:universal stress protein n=1 Tax=Reichenbachiella versicolor TaxID=1821036 RepID=UPI0013A59290|nr:universal stress protein [Reichenbachiella versicolor]